MTPEHARARVLSPSDPNAGSISMTRSKEAKTLHGSPGSVVSNPEQEKGNPNMKYKKILASSVAKLDSDVYTGGGTDDTAALQAVLDEARDGTTGIWLVMDGAALVSGLDLYSNTTIECLSRDCGFFQLADSNRSIVSNKDWDFGERKTRNISLLGGTYNQDCKHQAHHVQCPEGTREHDNFPGEHWIFTLEFYGVEYLTVRDLVIRNFRTFSTTIGNFRNVLIENVWLDLPDKMYAQNQDGFHFWGPGQFLTVKNVGGDVGDDFMNIGPDEHDGVSSITDVLVDGVMLDHADQAIRLLSHRHGTLDRVTIRNVTGTYRSFGFYVNCWFPGKTYGDFRNIFIENVDLREDPPVYDYRESFLFSIGGNVECLTMKNIRHHNPRDSRPLIELGLPFYDTAFQFPEDNLPRMQNIVLDGLSTFEQSEDSVKTDYIRVFAPIDRLVLRDVMITRCGSTAPDGHLIAFRHQGSIDKLYMHNITTNGLKRLIDDETKIEKIFSTNVITEK